MSVSLAAAAAVVRRDARVFYSYRWRALAQMVGTLLTLALFYELARLVSTRHFASPQAYFQFAAVGLALLPTLRALLVAPTALREELIAGTFEHFALSPFGPVAYLLCTLIFPFLVGLLSGVLTLALAAALFGLQVTLGTAALGVPVALLAALALAPFAALLLAGTLLVKQVTTGAGWVVAGLSVLGGAYFPVVLLPHWIRWAADAQPLTASLELLRHVLVGGAPASPVIELLMRLAGFVLLGLPVSAVILGLACSLARRRGTLLEY